MATDISVRQELIKRGISNDKIGYNPTTGSVTVNNQDFMKPPKIINNTSFTDQNTFNSAYDQYTKSRKPVVQAPPTGLSSTTSTASPSPSYQPPGYDYNSMIKSIMDQMKNQQPTDPYSTPAYAAATSQVNRDIAENQRRSREDMNRRGLFDSSMTRNQSQQIANQGTEYLNTQILPQIVAQEESRKQQALQNQFGVLDALMSQENLALNQANVTGSYLSPEMKNMYNEVISLKQQWDSAPPEQRPAIEARATEVRNLIAAMGGDTSLIGSDVTLQQAQGNAPSFGTPTMAAQNQQFNQGMQTRQQELNEMQIMATLTGFLPDGTPTNTYQQQQLQNEWTVAQQTGSITPILAKLYGIPEGTPTFEAQQAAISNALQRSQLAISQQNANVNADQAALARERFESEQLNQGSADMDAERRGLVSAIRSGEITPGQALQQIDEDLALGFYTPEEAALLKQDLATIAPNTPAPVSTPEQTTEQEDFRANLPSDKEIEAQAKKLGYPTLDYRSYAKDPKGMMSGLTFEQWSSLYGPRIK